MTRVGVGALLVSTTLVVSAAAATTPPVPHAQSPAAARVLEPFPWSADRRLTWNDFLGRPDMMTDASALTVYAMSVSWGCTGETFSYRVESMFQPGRSWVKPSLLMRAGGDSGRVLAHEQGHYDLSEVRARQLRKTFAELDDPCSRPDADMNALVTRHLREDAEIQQRYDRDTVYGLDTRRQGRWDADTGKWLATLTKYVH